MPISSRPPNRAEHSSEQQASLGSKTETGIPQDDSEATSDPLNAQAPSTDDRERSGFARYDESVQANLALLDLVRPDGKTDIPTSGRPKDGSQPARHHELVRESLARLGRFGSWEIDLVRNDVYWSPESCRIHGKPSGYRPTIEEVIDLYGVESGTVIRAALNSAAAGVQGFDLELPFTRSDGRTIWLRAVGSAETVDGMALKFLGIFEDITDRVRERLALESANDHLAFGIESGGIGIWDWNIPNDQMTWDPRMYRLYGMEPEDEIAEADGWSDHLHPDDVAAAERAVRAAIEGTDRFDTEFRVVWRDGSIHHLRASGRVSRDIAGRAVRMVGANWDISESRGLGARLAEEHRLFQTTLRSIADAVVTTDTLGRVTWLNPAAERMTGWSNVEARGRSVDQVVEIVNADTRKSGETLLARSVAQGDVAGKVKSLVLISRNSREFEIEESAAPICNDQGQTLGVVLVFHDVSEQRRLSAEMRYRASHDALTGLDNRIEFETRLRQVWESTQLDHRGHALLYIDLDEFKRVNDSCGHAAGDRFLVEVAEILSDIVRTRDGLARLGGDEFGAILECCSVDQAARVAQQICDRMEKFRFIHEGRGFRMSASIGLVPLDSRWPSVAAVLQAADTACYAAKEAGRNRVHTWSESDEAVDLRHGEMQWVTRLGCAFDEDRFVLFAQRVTPLASVGEGVYAEVLLRMRESDGSLVLPGLFLPAAERSHVATRIDRWVVVHVIAWMKSHPSLQRIEYLSINLSGQSVGDPTFLRWTIDTLRDAGPEICARLCFEIAETAAVTNLAGSTLFIKQVRAAGIRVALDNFGTGSSSFGYLKHLPIDILKIDGQFVRNILADRLDEVTVRCVADVAKVFGIKTVAEFVDSPEALERLRVMGIDFVQGSLIHEPAPIDEIFMQPITSSVIDIPI